MSAGALAATGVAVALALALVWAVVRLHTARRRAERAHAAARAAEAQLEAILSVMAEAVVVQGPQGELLHVNDLAGQMLGVENPKALIGSQGGLGVFEHFDLFDEEGRRVSVNGLPGRRVLAGEHPEPMYIRAIHKQTGRERWALVKASAVRDAQTGAPRLAVTVIEEVTAERQATEAATYLAEASRLIGATTDFGGVVERVAQAAVSHMAEWCVVDVLDEHREIAQTTIAPRDAHVGAPPSTLRDTDAALRVARASASEVSDDGRVLVAPLSAGSLSIGAITLVRSESSAAFRRADVVLLEELGRRAGVAIESARITRERAHVAATLQRSLLPPHPPEVPGLSVAARFRAAGEANQVGGDFYDVFEAEGAWWVVIGDVTGKGAEAASITSVARYTMRTAAHYEADPADVLARLNEALLREVDPTHPAPPMRRLCTAVCMRIDVARPGGPRVLVASAGHPLPWRVDADGSLTEICSPGPLLGAFDDGAWQTTALELRPGTALVLYTDGVTDTSGRDGRFGVDRVRAVLRNAAGQRAETVAGALDDALRRFQDGPQDDDVAMLVLRADDVVNIPTLRSVRGGAS